MPPHTIQEQSAKRKVALRQRFAGQRRDLATKPMVRPGINAVSATRDTHSPMRADIPAPKISAPGRAPGIGYSHQILPGRQIDASTCTGTKAMSKRIWAKEKTRSESQSGGAVQLRTGAGCHAVFRRSRKSRHGITMPNPCDRRGARTRACRVETLLDTSSARSPASARVPTRHARVRAPPRNGTVIL